MKHGFRAISLLSILSLWLITLTSCSSDNHNTAVVTPAADTTPSHTNAAYAFYIKNGELMMMNTGDRCVYPVTAHLNTVSDAGAASMRLTETNDRLFYLDAESDDASEKYLFVRETRHMDAAPTKLDSVSALFDISKNGDTVLYTKLNDHGGQSLYLHDLTTGTKLTDSLNGFGFTANDDLPYFSFPLAGETMYAVVKGTEQHRCTAEEFEAQYGGKRPLAYHGNAEVDLKGGCVRVDGDIVDTDIPYIGGGFEAYFNDRFLYFTIAEETLHIKQYICGGAPQVLTEMPKTLIPQVGYTTDGLPLYLQNTNSQTHTADLVLFQDGQHITIDHGVTGIVQFHYIVNVSHSIQAYMQWQ